MKQEQLVKLLSQMTLDEKIAQLLQLNGDFYSCTNIATGPAVEFGITKDDVNNAGSILSAIGAERLKNIQKNYLENNRHKIPMLFMADVINGFKTIFPISLGLGATFNPELVEQSAAVAAKEASVSGIHITFSPMVDLVRDARWGRVMESTGEDTYLNCLFAKAMVKGYQGDNLKEEGKIGACVKHFAAYGAPIGGREYNSVEVSEKTLREEYLPSYKAAIDAGSSMVMTAFNTIDGIPCSGNKKLMKDILREEWGFDGVLISDYAAIQEIITHGVAEDAKEAARIAIEAGVDIDMMTSVYVKNLKSLVEEEKISEKQIDECVMRVLKLKNKLGLFENPYKDADEIKEKQVILCKEHLNIAKKVVDESIVLLKNEGILPLKKENQSIAFIGPYVDSKEINGMWSLFGEKEKITTIKEAVISKLNTSVTEVQKEAQKLYFAKGCDILDSSTVLWGFSGNVSGETDEGVIKKNLEEAIAVAKKAEVVVMAMGEHCAQSGEGGSRAEITLPEHQMELFRKVYEVNQNIVVVLFNGRPLDIRELNKKAKAIVEAWFPGTEGSNSIVDVLYGDVNPSGKLSMSFPYCVGQVPVCYNKLHTGRPKELNSKFNRFTSGYIDSPNEPLFPFGYGLSYSKFEFSNFEIDCKELTDDNVIHVSIMVTNNGKYNGKETVQMYIHDISASVARPIKELKGFKKIFLKAGESKKVVFEIKEEMLRFYTANMNYTSEAGKHEIFIGSDSTAEVCGEFYLIK